MDTAALMTAVAVAQFNDVVTCYNLFLHSDGPIMTAGARQVASTNWKTRIAEWSRDAGVGQSETFTQALRSVTCDVRMVPDGTVLRPGTPFARVEGPAAQAAVMASMVTAMCAAAATIATSAYRARSRMSSGVVIYDGDSPACAFIGGADATSSAVPVEGMRRIVVEHPDLHCLSRNRAKALETVIRLFGGDVLLFAHDLESLRMAAHAGIALRRAGKNLLGVWVDDSATDETVQEFREILDAPGLKDVAIYRRSVAGTFSSDSPIIHPDGSGLVRGTYQLGAVQSNGYWDSRPWSKDVPAGVAQVRRVRTSGGLSDGVFDIVYDEAVGLVDADTVPVEPLVGGGAPTEVPGAGEDLLLPILTSAQPTSFPETLAEARERSDAQAALFGGHTTHLAMRDANAAEMERGALRP